MSIAKPFTFISGTYAKSAEVNADFDTAYSQINTNISNITKNASDITSLDSTKANINGNASEVFNVANPTASSHAINKQTFFNLTSNMKYFIAGYTISVDSGSPNNTIIVSEGSCYDSAYQVMLTKNVATTKQNTTQTASATYYVYVIGNSTGSSVDILISTSSSNPGLPTGYTVYRQIGYYITNGNSKISGVHYYGHGATEDVSPERYQSYRNINYSSGVSVTAPTSSAKYTAPYDGVYITTVGKNNSTATLYINGAATAYYYHDAADGANYINYTIPLSKGDIIYWNATMTTDTSKFYKYKA